MVGVSWNYVYINAIKVLWWGKNRGGECHKRNNREVKEKIEKIKKKINSIGKKYWGVGRDILKVNLFHFKMDPAKFKQLKIQL